MNSISNIFKEELVEKYLEFFYSTKGIINFDMKWNLIKKWKKSCANIQKTKEKAIQGLFLNQIFGDILNYKTAVDAEIEYNQLQEFKSFLDASEADGALGFFTSTGDNDVRVVIELKDANTDLEKKQYSNHLTPIDQAFIYASKDGYKVGWVIVSNFIETRLYKNPFALEYERFNIMDMDDKKAFKRFYYFLCKENLISKFGNSIIDNLYIENQQQEKIITKQFYKDYKQIRNNLWISLKSNNLEKDELMLFRKSQKLMDRIIFICFCEDCLLLPEHTIKRIIDSSKYNDYSCSDTKIWDRLMGLFKAINEGNPSMGINHYNGGLFKEDDDLNKLIIKDEITEQFEILSNYDFKSQLNVNILGHIFEQSISDIDEIKREVQGIVDNEKNGKQKDDGIFYTPYYVTRYIVENTIGRYLEDTKKTIKNNLIKNGYITSVKKRKTGRENKIKLAYWEDIPDKVAKAEKIADIYPSVVG